MDKKIFALGLLIVLLGIPIIFSSSPPQFLIFQGDVTIDGRPVNQGTIVNFSINGTELDSDFTDENGEYDVFIQGFSEHFGKEINITIDGYKTEQKIDYIYPQDIFLDLSALTEKALRITKHNPETETITITKAQNTSFDISTKSGYEDLVNHTWFLDREKVDEFPDKNSSSFEHEITNSDKGIHEITVSATDGFLTVFKEWTLIIERPEIENFDGDTTDFNSLGLDELENVQNVVLEKTGKGKIEFLESLNLSGVTDLNSRVKIERGIVAIDSSFYPQLNKPARITLTGVSYNTIPEIFFTDGFTTNPLLINKECDFCNIISFTNFPTTNGEIIFEVDHFSSFKAGESGNKHDLSLFDDLDTCEAGIQGDLILNVKDPDERDEFGVGEKIDVEIEVKNNADDDKRIIVEVSLYNIDEDDEIEDTNDDKKIKDDDEEDFNLILEIPDDFEDDSYLVFVKAYEDNHEESQCVEGVIDIDLEREKHEVIIKKISVNPKEVLAGKGLEVEVDVENIGESDEDVYVVLEIRELNVSTKSEVFEIEEFGEDDSFSGNFFIEIPDNAKKGEYKLEIKAVFDDEQDVKEETIFILGKIPIVKETIFINKEIVDIREEKAIIVEKEKLETKTRVPLFVPWLLIEGIIILIILIAVVGLGKRK